MFLYNTDIATVNGEHIEMLHVFSPNITITVDWALKTNYLSIIYIFLYNTDIAAVKGLLECIMCSAQI